MKRMRAIVFLCIVTVFVQSKAVGTPSFYVAAKDVFTPDTTVVIPKDNHVLTLRCLSCPLPRLSDSHVLTYGIAGRVRAAKPGFYPTERFMFISNRSLPKKILLVPSIADIHVILASVDQADISRLSCFISPKKIPFLMQSIHSLPDSWKLKIELIPEPCTDLQEIRRTTQELIRSMQLSIEKRVSIERKFIPCITSIIYSFVDPFEYAVRANALLESKKTCVVQ